MSTSLRTRVLDPQVVHFGGSLLCEMHYQLQRDLIALTAVHGEPIRLTWEALTQELPTRFRSFNAALIKADGYAIADWCQQEDPLFVKEWCASVSRAVGKPNEVLESRTLREEVALTIFAIRQYTGFASRLTTSGPRYSEQCREALVSFKDRCTRDLEDFESDPLFQLVGEVFFQGFSLRDVYHPDANLCFRHGPGAVAERMPSVRTLHGPKRLATLAEKQALVEAQRAAAFAALPLDPWYGRAPMAVDYDRPRPVSQERSCFEYGEGIPSSPSRVQCVPKDFRGPRVIAAMTAWKVYVQGAFDTLLRRHLRRCPLAKRVDLNDQTRNRDAALQASRDLKNATVDLKDASDMIHLKVIEDLFKFRPDLLAFFYGSRAERVLLPNGEIVNLTSAFTMGEPDTFPLESIVFLLEGLTEYLHEHIREIRRIDWQTLCWAADQIDIRVYGDDILVRRWFVEHLAGRFANRGFVVNQSKCCYRGFFREACGCDAWMGEDVTPLRPRQLPGADEQTLSGHLETISNLAEKGLIRCALTLYNELCKVRIVPPVLPSSISIPGCVHSDLLHRLSDRRAITVNKKHSSDGTDYQRPFLRVWVERVRKYTPKRDDGRYWLALSGIAPDQRPTGYPADVVLVSALEDSQAVDAGVFSKVYISLLLGD